MAFGNLKFDTLTTSDAINTNTEKSLDTSYVFNGVCKVWANFDGTAGTLAARDSFNIGSLTDVNTGVYQMNFTNNMNNDDYSGVVSGASDNYENSSLRSEAQTTTSTMGFFMFLNASDAASDNTIVSGQIQGDVA